MRSGETRESWRRCHWWKEPHLDCEEGKEYPWSILFHQCGECAVKDTILADAYATIEDLRAERVDVPFEDEKARGAVNLGAHGYCTYCGELILKSKTKRQEFYWLTKPLDELTFCRGVWWMPAHGVDHWRRCHWWDVDEAASLARLDGKTVVGLRQCLRCGEEAQVLDSALGVSPLQGLGARERRELDWAFSRLVVHPRKN